MRTRDQEACYLFKSYILMVVALDEFNILAACKILSNHVN